MDLKAILKPYLRTTQVETNPAISGMRKTLTQLGVIKRQYGTGRGRHLKVDPDVAERIGNDLIEIAREARREQE